MNNYFQNAYIIFMSLCMQKHMKNQAKKSQTLSQNQKIRTLV